MFLDDFSFDKLISPFTSDVFFSEYFEKKPLLIKRSESGFYRGLLEPTDLDRIFFYWPNMLSNVNAEKNDGARISLGSAIKQRNVQSVLKALDDGSTMVLDGLDSRHPPLTQLCAMLEIEHTWVYQTNIYITPGNSQGFKTHTDSHNVFILQTSGSKNWRVNRAPTPLENRSQENDCLEIDENDHMEFVLEQGDLVYIPKGFAHDATSREGYSVHITLSPHPPSMHDFMAYVMKKCRDDFPGLEHSLPPGYVTGDADTLAGQAREWFQQLAEADLAKISDMLQTESRDRFRGVFFGALENRIEHPAIRGGSRYVKNTLLLSHVEVGDESYRLFTPQKTVEMPALFKDQIEFCLSGREFRAADIPDMTAQEQQVLLTRLLVEGLVLEVT
jgi:ribosomal protein L16 Arg81 hydroxylase